MPSWWDRLLRHAALYLASELRRSKPPQELPPLPLCDEHCAEWLETESLKDAAREAMRRELYGESSPPVTPVYQTIEIRVADEHGHNNLPTVEALQAGGFVHHKRVPNTPTTWWMIKGLRSRDAAS